MCAWDETGDIEEFYGDGSPAFDAGAVVGFAAVGDIEAGAGAGNLEVADGALRVDGRKSRDTELGYALARARVERRSRNRNCDGRRIAVDERIGRTYGKLPTSNQPTPSSSIVRLRTDFGSSICQAAVYILESARWRGGGAARTCSALCSCPTKACQQGR
jgi:hypothetical protein